MTVQIDEEVRQDQSRGTMPHVRCPNSPKGLSGARGEGNSESGIASAIQHRRPTGEIVGRDGMVRKETGVLFPTQCSPVARCEHVPLA